MRKIIALTLIFIASLILLCGCGKNRRESSQSFDSSSISHINIDVGDHPIVLEDAQGEEITLSLSEDVKQIGTIEEQSLKIKLQPQSGIINIKEPSKLVIGIPGEWNGSVDVTSKAGTAQAENVSLLYLAFRSDSGNIILKNVSGEISTKTNSGKIEASSITKSQLNIETDSGAVLLNNISGTISAKTDSGRIQVPNNLADQVKPGNMNLGEVLELQIDNTDTCTIKVYTNAGNIKID